VSSSQSIIMPQGAVTDLISSPVTFTDQWQDIGHVIECGSSISMVLWLDIEVNDSTEIYFRPVAYDRKYSDDYYEFPTEEIHTGVNKFYPKVYQLQKIADQRVMFQVNPARMMPYIGIQIMDATIGAVTRAKVKSLKFSARN